MKVLNSTDLCSVSGGAQGQVENSWNGVFKDALMSGLIGAGVSLFESYSKGKTQDAESMIVKTAVVAIFCAAAMVGLTYNTQPRR